MRKLLFASIFILTFCFVVFGQDSPCPIINLQGPASIPEPDGTAIFSAFVLKDPKDPLNLYKGEKKLEYVWTVRNGKIVNGQGTMFITVRFDSNLSTIIATVEVKGLPDGCSNTVSEIAVGDPLPEAKFVDELVTSAPQIDSTKFDKLITVLTDEPTATAYIIIYTDEKTSPKKLRKKEQQIRKYLSEKNVPPERVVIVNGGNKGDLIRLFIVPVGAKPPTP